MAITRRQQTAGRDDGVGAPATAATTTGTRQQSSTTPAPDGTGSKKALSLPKLVLALLAAIALVGGGAWYYIVPHARPLDLRRGVLTPERLNFHCEEHIGPPRVEEVTEGVFVAIGYDLANTILIRTAEGHVVVDVAMNPKRASRMREALEAVAGKAPIHSIVYTHSHVVGGRGCDDWDVIGLAQWWVGSDVTSASSRSTQPTAIAGPRRGRRGVVRERHPHLGDRGLDWPFLQAVRRLPQGTFAT